MYLNKKKYEDGMILKVDKPIGWTSFDIVNKIRNTLKLKKIGHAGTLDPLASGLLIVCTGKYTKKIQEYQNFDKEYTGSFIIGKTTPSHDLETEFISDNSIKNISEDEIIKTTKTFIGNQNQIPPKYSAIKVNGERAYKKARNKENVILKSREVKINKFEITSINLPKIDFLINCSKGTYIRAIARDYGKKLKVGAFLNELKRTKIGNISIKDSMSIDKLISKIKKDLNEDNKE